MKLHERVIYLGSWSWCNLMHFIMIWTMVLFAVIVRFWLICSSSSKSWLGYIRSQYTTV